MNYPTLGTKYAGARRPLSLVLAAVLALSLPATLAACSDNVPEGGTPGVTEAITLPDLTDDRTPTDVAAYEGRFAAAFATTSPAPETDFTYTVSDGGVTVTGYTGSEMTVVIPDTMGGNPVTTIAEGAFAGKGTMQALSIPDSVTVIGIGALEGCRSLTTLRTPVFTCETAPYFGALFGATDHEINGSAVPATLSTLILTAGVTVPDYAFYDCRGLEAVSLPATVESIGAFAFYGNKSLAYMPLDHTALVTVGERAMTNCASLLSLSLPATVDRMGFAFLEGCGRLETLTLPFVGRYRPGSTLSADEQRAVNHGEAPAPAEAAYLGYLFGAADYAFSAGYLPASLITLTLHEGCGDVPPNAFFECATLRSVVLPAGVTSIGRRAFYGCESLAGITLPATVTTLGEDAFRDCIRLTALEGGEGLTTLGVQAFMGCLSLSSVTLPATVTHLPNAAFSGCLSLTTLTAPGVTTQGAQVFRHCDKLQGWNTSTETSAKGT